MTWSPSKLWPQDRLFLDQGHSSRGRAGRNEVLSSIPSTSGCLSDRVHLVLWLGPLYRSHTRAFCNDYLSFPIMNHMNYSTFKGRKPAESVDQQCYPTMQFMKEAVFSRHAQKPLLTFLTLKAMDDTLTITLNSLSSPHCFFLE